MFKLCFAIFVMLLNAQLSSFCSQPNMAIYQSLKECKAVVADTFDKLLTPQPGTVVLGANHAAIFRLSKILIAQAHALIQTVATQHANANSEDDAIEPLVFGITQSCEDLLLSNQANITRCPAEMVKKFCAIMHTNPLFTATTILAHHLPVLTIPTAAATTAFKQLQLDALYYVTRSLDSALQDLALFRNSDLTKSSSAHSVRDIKNAIQPFLNETNDIAIKSSKAHYQPNYLTINLLTMFSNQTAPLSRPNVVSNNSRTIALEGSAAVFWATVFFTDMCLQSITPPKTEKHSNNNGSSGPRYHLRRHKKTTKLSA